MEQTLYVGDDGKRDYLLTVDIDGTHTIATRVDPWDTWSRPTVLHRQSEEVS